MRRYLLWPEPHDHVKLKQNDSGHGFDCLLFRSVLQSRETGPARGTQSQPTECMNWDVTKWLQENNTALALRLLSFVIPKQNKNYGIFS